MRGRMDARYMLLICFLAGLLAGAMMLTDGWDIHFWATSAAYLGASVLLALGLVPALMVGAFRRDIAGFGAQSAGLAGLAAMRDLRDADLMLIDEPMLLRRSGRCLAAQQPRLDPRLSPVMLGLAKHGGHPLTIALANSLEGRGVAPEMVSNVDVQSSGQVRAEWRGHSVMLFVQPIGYGDTKLVIHLHMDGEPAAAVVFDEDIRSDAPPMLHALRHAGVVPVLYAPDSAQMLGPMARQLGVMAQGFMRAEDMDLAIQRHCAAGHVPLILSLATGLGTWALRSGGTGRLVLTGQDMAAIPMAIAAARRLMAMKGHAVRVIAMTHIGALAMMLSGWTMPVIAAMTWGLGAAAMWWIGQHDIKAVNRKVGTDAVKKAATI